MNKYDSDLHYGILLEDLMYYYSDAEDRYVEVTVNDDKSTYIKPCYFYELLTEAREKSESRNEVKFAPAYRSKDLGHERSDYRNILSANCFWLDIKSPDSSLSFEQQYEAIQNIFGKFMVCLSHYRRITPTCVISSGYAFHLLFAMNKEYFAPFMDLIEIQAALAKMVDGVQVTDITGFLHMPGTFNYQDRENPKKIEVVHDYRHLYGYEWQTGCELFDKSNFDEILEIYR